MSLAIVESRQKSFFLSLPKKNEREKTVSERGEREGVQRGGMRGGNRFPAQRFHLQHLKRFRALMRFDKLCRAENSAKQVRRLSCWASRSLSRPSEMQNYDFPFSLFRLILLFYGIKED